MPEGLPIEKLDVTFEFNQISDEVWQMVKRWPTFEMQTIGQQLVRSIDSVAANIVEGGHRESDLEAVRHFVIARASGEEALNWLERVKAGCIEPIELIEDILKRIGGSLAKLERLIAFRRRRASSRKPVQ